MKKYILLTLISLLFISPVYADDLTGVPTTGVKYTLTYPDGTTIETTDYNEVVEAFKEENWKDLGTYKTNELGIIELNGLNDTGTIKIIEKVIPLGYSATKTEYIVPLSDKEIKIVNNKKEVKGEEEVPNTNDNIIMYISLLLLSSITILMLYKNKARA